MLKNPRHERMVQFLAQGKTAAEAYELAGYKPNRWNAAFLARQDKIRERLTQINTEFAAAHQITKEKLIGWHNDIRQQGMVSGQLAPAGTAIKEISVLTGHRVERQEVGAPGEFESMSDDKLEAMLIQRIAELGLTDVGEAGLARMPIDDTQH